MSKSFQIQSFEDFIQQMEKTLKNPLPGYVAHRKMAAEVLNHRKLYEYDPLRTKTGSVLIHFYEKDSRIFITLIERQKYDGVHSGQISFPGGKKDKADSSVYITALREAEEEVNIYRDQVKIIGSLSPIYIAASDFKVHPILGYSLTIPDFVADKKEVAKIINFPVEQFLTYGIIKETLLNIQGTQIQTPYYDIEGKIVWGATAMILSELIAVVQTFAS